MVVRTSDFEWTPPEWQPNPWAIPGESFVPAYSEHHAVFRLAAAKYFEPQETTAGNHAEPD